MKHELVKHGLTVLAASAALLCAVASAQAQTKKPNVLFIMGDDIGWMQPSIYHRGLMVGETPNIDRIGREGGIFMHYCRHHRSSSTGHQTMNPWWETNREDYLHQTTDGRSKPS